jgi:hypothetical protein
MNEDIKNLSRKADRIISLLEVLVLQNERGTYTYDDDEDEEERPIPILSPIMPSFPETWPENKPTTCPSCGMEFKGVMGYACSKVGCPMGVGPTTC